MKDRSVCYVAYFDCLGFECILNASGHEHRNLLLALKNQPRQRFPLNSLLLRAKANSQRNPEIWSFWSEIDLNTLLQCAKESPQELADLIRANGSPLFTTVKPNQVIK